MNWIGCFWLLCMSYASSTGEHDIHVSIVEISIEESHLEVSTRIFYDDLLATFGLQLGEQLPEEFPSADSLIADFLEEHIMFFADEKQLEWEYLESFSSPPAVWTSLKLPLNWASTKSFSIKNTILLDLFDDQLNMIHLNNGTTTNSYPLDIDNFEIKIK